MTDPSEPTLAELCRPPSAAEPPRVDRWTRRGLTLTPAQARQYARQERSRRHVPGPGTTEGIGDG